MLELYRVICKLCYPAGADLLLHVTERTWFARLIVQWSARGNAEWIAAWSLLAFD